MSSNNLSPARQALSHPDFARYAYGRFGATLAWQMIDVVLGYQMWKLTRNEAYLGYIGLAQFLPFVVLLLPGGQIADRFDRRLIIALAYSLELVAAAALLLFTLSGRTDAYPLFFIAALLGVGRAFWAPAGQSMVPNLVPKELLGGAISFNTLLFTIATIGGPAVAGLTLLLGIDWSYGIAVALLMGAMFMILGVKPVRAKSSSEWRWHDFLDGFVFVWKKKPVLGAISLDLFAVLFGGVVALIPAYADKVLHVGTVGMGMMRAAPGVGAAIVAFSLGRNPIKRHAGTWMFGGVAVFGVCMITVGLSTTVWLSVLALAIAGAGDMVSVFVRGMLVQLETPDSIRGRVSAVNSMFIGASNELGAFRAGVQARWMGIVPSMIWGGVCTLAVVASYLRLFPQLRKLDRFPEPVH
ncbi:MAG TPA: MFS transporter [Steroidobacteraceae bacterium]|nr:MFS transporter [Steroidobacteraceae bacterium]